MAVDDSQEEGGPMPQRFRAGGGCARSAAGGSPAKRVRILAYGDSLTAGYYEDGDRFSPYGATLAKLLAPDFDAEVWVCGLSSLTAVQMVKRLSLKKIKDGAGRTGKGLQRIILEEGPFDLVLIMAGTNDLASSQNSRAIIVSSVLALHGACHELRLRTAVLSVPPNAMVPLDRQEAPTSSRRLAAYRARWEQTNARLKEWASGTGAADGAVLFVDTEPIVPFTKDSELWEEDGLHLSPAGSRQLGEGLAKALAPVLRTLPTVACAPMCPRRLAPMPEVVRAPAAAASKPGVVRRRLLAYGDSLTAGCYGWCNLFTPYAEGLVTALLPDVAAEVWICGLSGLTADEMVAGLSSPSLEDVVGRKGKGLRHILDKDQNLDAAVIMAGTNDLADSPLPAKVVSDVRALHEACHRAGVPTIVLSVPPSRASQRQAKYEALRVEVNRQLLTWAKGAPHGARSNGDAHRAGVLAFVDAERLMPYDSDSGFWEPDGLHFTREGSLHFGVRLAEKLRALMATSPLAAQESLSSPVEAVDDFV